MRPLRFLVLPLLVCVTLGATRARATELYFPGGALDGVPSGSCTRTPNVGANQLYTTMDCTSSWSQGFVAHGEVNPDAGLTFTVHIFWVTTSSATNNVCWNVANAVCTSNLGACNYDQITPANSTATTALANLSGGNLLMESTFTGITTENLYQANIASNCGGTDCNGKPLVVVVNRDNSGSCASNLPATVKVVGMRVVFN